MLRFLCYFNFGYRYGICLVRWKRCSGDNPR